MWKGNLRFWLVAVVLLVQLPVVAQLLYNSPYSRYGLGTVRADGYNQNSGMGGVGIATENLLFINTVNPALLHRTKYTAFDFGVVGRSNNLETPDGLQAASGDANLFRIGMAFPLGKKATTHLSVAPWSTLSYDVSDQTLLSDGSIINYDYTGSGGANKISFGNAYRFLDDTVSGTMASVGLDIGYIFGTLERQVTSQLEIDGSLENTKFFNSDLDVHRGFQFRPGVHLRKEIKVAQVKKKRDLVIYRSRLDSINDVLRDPAYEFYKEVTIEGKNVTAKGKKKDPRYILYASKRVITPGKDTLTEYELIFRDALPAARQKVIFKDTLVNSATLKVNSQVEKLSLNAYEGKHIVIFPDVKHVVIDKAIKSSDERRRLFGVVAALKNRTQGVYLKPSAQGKKYREILSDYNETLAKYASSDKGDPQGAEIAKAMIKRHSGIFYSFGAFYELGSTLNTSHTSIIERRDANTSLISVDTTFNETGVNTYLPSTIGVGFSLNKPTQQGVGFAGFSPESIWTLGLDFRYTPLTANVKQSLFGYTEDSWKIAFGGQFVPDFGGRSGSELHKRIMYRAGLHYGTLPFKFGDGQLTEFGIDFGLSLPLGVFNTRMATRLPKYVNISLSAGQRGTTAKDQIREQYFDLGLSFTVNEKWFGKRKIGL